MKTHIHARTQTITMSVLLISHQSSCQTRIVFLLTKDKQGLFFFFVIKVQIIVCQSSDMVETRKQKL